MTFSPSCDTYNKRTTYVVCYRKKTGSQKKFSLIRVVSAGGACIILRSERFSRSLPLPPKSSYGWGLREFLEQAQELAVELVAVEVLVRHVLPTGVEDAE